jgi:hypothetical protein
VSYPHFGGNKQVTPTHREDKGEHMFHKLKVISMAKKNKTFQFRRHMHIETEGLTKIQGNESNRWPKKSKKKT